MGGGLHQIIRGGLHIIRGSQKRGWNRARSSQSMPISSSIQLPRPLTERASWLQSGRLSTTQCVSPTIRESMRVGDIGDHLGWENESVKNKNPNPIRRIWHILLQAWQVFDINLQTKNHIVGPFLPSLWSLRALPRRSVGPAATLSLGPQPPCRHRSSSGDSSCDLHVCWMRCSSQVLLLARDRKVVLASRSKLRLSKRAIRSWPLHALQSQLFSLQGFGFYWNPCG